MSEYTTRAYLTVRGTHESGVNMMLEQIGPEDDPAARVAYWAERGYTDTYVARVTETTTIERIDP